MQIILLAVNSELHIIIFIKVIGYGSAPGIIVYEVFRRLVM